MQFFCNSIAFLPLFVYNVNMFNFIYKNIDFAHKLNGHTTPSDDFHKHMHDHYELLYLVRGNIDYTIESETKKLVAGEVLMIAPGMLHFGTVDPNSAYERYVLKFPATVLPEFMLKKIENLKFCGIIPKIQELFEELDYIYANFDDEERNLLMYTALFRIIIRVYKSEMPVFDEQIHHNAIIAEIINYINKNIKRPIALADICQDLHFSKSYISSEFSKEMKTPVMTYIKHKKIIAAHRQITEGKTRLINVAEEFGFSEYSTFYRNYKKIIGYPPQDGKR